MSLCTRANASPKSLVSVKARPPVSAASEVSVSCDAASCRTAARRRGRRTSRCRARSPAARRRRARPPAARACRSGRRRRWPRTAALIAARSSTWLSCPLRCMPGAEVDDRLLLLDRRQRVGERLQRAQADVVVEHVEVGRVRSRRRRSPRRPLRRWPRWSRRAARRRCPRCSRAWSSAVATLPRSAVKSVSTLSVELTVTTATRSAVLIFSLTYFCAESTARCTSSGCIELTSNSSVISRRPAIDSEVSASAGAGSRAAATDDGDRVCSWSFASTPASRSAVSILAGALSLDLFEAEVEDLLRPAVLADLEVVGGQAADDRAALVADDGVDGDHFTAWSGRPPLRRLGLAPAHRPAEAAAGGGCCADGADRHASAAVTTQAADQRVVS